MLSSLLLVRCFQFKHIMQMAEYPSPHCSNSVHKSETSSEKHRQSIHIDFHTNECSTTNKFTMDRTPCRTLCGLSEYKTLLLTIHKKFLLFLPYFLYCLYFVKELQEFPAIMQLSQGRILQLQLHISLLTYIQHLSGLQDSPCLTLQCTVYSVNRIQNMLPVDTH